MRFKANAALRKKWIENGKYGEVKEIVCEDYEEIGRKKGGFWNWRSGLHIEDRPNCSKLNECEAGFWDDEKGNHACDGLFYVCPMCFKEHRHYDQAEGCCAEEKGGSR